MMLAKVTLAFLCIAVFITETVFAQPVQVADSPLVVADEAEAPALSADELSAHEFSLDELPALRQFLDETAVDDQNDFGVQENPATVHNCKKPRVLRYVRVWRGGKWHYWIECRMP
ncbi:uncharacterized protein LOC108674929 [Hyalella azteca]|uniref:Uncharacterized protein LOC108674929 n=1 Tax=Hyalella azteca TaxID=294128 RepID=A0A8B7NXB2_HYAAZ|nr:uncharacterized protein LOC108674929 [Hyalella azteca]